MALITVSRGWVAWLLAVLRCAPHGGLGLRGAHGEDPAQPDGERLCWAKTSKH